MTRYVSMLRGINVGGHKKVKMDALKDLYESLGFNDAVTYVQSGNVVFRSDIESRTQLAGLIEREFENEFGFHSSVILRSSDELTNVIKNNPFKNMMEKEAKYYHVMFLASSPDDESKNELRETYNGPEKFFMSDVELYIHYINGAGRSKLNNNYIEKKLKVPGTSRNWNTVTKLLDLTKDL